MKSRPNFFDRGRDKHKNLGKLPEGFRYQLELISQDDEASLLAHMRDLHFRDFEFHSYTGKRKVISFGWRYDFSGRRLQKADDIPDYLLSLRKLVASFSGIEPEQFEHVLVTEYGPGAGIGWHRDKAVFGEVVGISLLSPCMFRMRRSVDRNSVGRKKWERVNLVAEPRSAYYLGGSARYEWEHSIPQMEALRYSITFRNLR